MRDGPKNVVNCSTMAPARAGTTTGGSTRGTRRCRYAVRSRPARLEAAADTGQLVVEAPRPARSVEFACQMRRSARRARSSSRIVQPVPERSRAWRTRTRESTARTRLNVTAAPVRSVKVTPNREFRPKSRAHARDVEHRGAGAVLLVRREVGDIQAPELAGDLAAGQAARRSGACRPAGWASRTARCPPGRTGASRGRTGRIARSR